jgi:hypothetical protein
MVVNFLSPLADSCPSCHPGDYPAVLPFIILRDGDGLRAWYKHEPCQSAWSCGWDAEACGWPQDRTVIPAGEPAPVTPEEAARHRAVLLRELSACGRYHAGTRPSRAAAGNVA